MFIVGFEKIAGVDSEVGGTIGWIGTPSILGGVLGLAEGKHSKAEQKKIDKKTWSNIIIPGLGAYRLARRNDLKSGSDKKNVKK